MTQQHQLHPGNRVECHVTRSWGRPLLTPGAVTCSECGEHLAPPIEGQAPPGTGCALAVVFGVVFWVVVFLTWLTWVR